MFLDRACSVGSTCHHTPRVRMECPIGLYLSTIDFQVYHTMRLSACNVLDGLLHKYWSAVKTVCCKLPMYLCMYCMSYVMWYTHSCNCNCNAVFPRYSSIFYSITATTGIARRRPSTHLHHVLKDGNCLSTYAIGCCTAQRRSNSTQTHCAGQIQMFAPTHQCQ